ncbi:MAG TPA: sulfite exporter TauE/SafE family protein [Thermoanaerobaculia bacterium]|nr:sulfite exporter TauE/SafE family protein [Thermoanaerobaculia bacterium]
MTSCKFAADTFILHPSSFILFAAAFLAGIVNSIAGGGTLISFPSLLWIGRNAIIANATSTIALWPGSLSGMLGFRRDLATLPRRLYILIVPSLAGGIAGAMLLLHTSTKTFERLVPWLILGATMLLAFQGVITKRIPHRWPLGLIILLQLLVAFYGGYFGAGIGILMLAALGLIGLTDLHQMNGLKNLLAICINGVAAVYFAASGAVIWSDAILMAIAAIAGGFSGAKLAHVLGRRFVRGFVIAVGLCMTVALFLKR